jgi:hypothetical protein
MKKYVIVLLAESYFCLFGGEEKNSVIDGVQEVCERE